MENFFNWMSKPIPADELVIWFGVHNIIYERLELYGDIFKSLNHTIINTYLGETIGISSETKILLTQEDKDSHFEWCWNKVVDDFNKENIKINPIGDHKEYLKSFYEDSFYNQPEKNVRESISIFLVEIFDIFKQYTKSDLDMITDFYKIMEKNVK
jgi:hypothetical protein